MTPFPLMYPRFGLELCGIVVVSLLLQTSPISVLVRRVFFPSYLARTKPATQGYVAETVERLLRWQQFVSSTTTQVA